MIKKKIIKKVLFELIMIFLSLIIIVPLLIMLLGSLKTSGEAASFNLNLPGEWKFDNYLYVFKYGGIGRAMSNSIFIALCAVPVCLIGSALCSFIFARRASKISNLLFNIVIMGMIAPMSIIPTIWLLRFLDISGTYISVIFLYIAINLPWSVFIFTGFIKSIPRELDEAAIVDGCSLLRLFFQIVLPLLIPPFVTNLVIVAMAIWNDFMIPLYFFNTAKKWTMPLSIYYFFGRYYRDWNYVFAVLVLTALPVVVLYMYCQKHIVAGMTTGAIKG